MPDDCPARKNELVPDPVKIRFVLDQEEDGWPPAGSEGIWAVPLGGNLYRVDNTPWFVRGVAAEDTIEADVDEHDRLEFVQVRERGGHNAVRVIPRVDGLLGGSLQLVLEQFAPHGVTGEGMSSPVSMVALDIGPDAPLPVVKALLVSGESNGLWYYEEGCITDEWRVVS